MHGRPKMIADINVARVLPLSIFGVLLGGVNDFQTQMRILYIHIYNDSSNIKNCSVLIILNICNNTTFGLYVE